MPLERLLRRRSPTPVPPISQPFVLRRFYWTNMKSNVRFG